MMGRVLTNNTSMVYSVESALGTAGTNWFLLEPNSIGRFGSEISTTARAPISKNRQRRKGAITDLDSGVELDHDTTISVLTDFVEGFLFATAVNADMDFSPSAVDGTGDAFTVTALTAAQADKLEFSAGEYATLVYARNFTNSANNGLHQLDADAATSATSVAVTSTLTEEALPPANSQLQLAGLRLLNASTDFTFAYSGTDLTITEGGTIVGFDWSVFGLTVGQFVFIGSPDGSGNIQNALQDSAADDTYGYARVKSITAQVLTLEKASSTLQVTSPTSDATVDILFGKFVRNVATDNSNFLERSFQFEAEWVNLDTGGGDMYEYAKGNFCSQMTVEIPLTDKSTTTFAFVGTDTDPPMSSGDRKAGASSATQPAMTAALSSVSDLARLGVSDVDETGLTTDFKSVSLTLNNNVSPEKVLGQLGAKFLNVGNFDVDLETQVLFTEAAVVDRIRNNTTVSMDMIMRNGDGAIAVDIPSMTLGDGSRDLPTNESVLVNLSGQAFQDSALGYSLGVSFFPVAPAT